MIPQAPDIEQSVLGACLIDREALEIAKEQVQVDYFHNPNHQLIFKAILEVEQPDLISVEQKLRDWSKFNLLGPGYLAGLTLNTSPWHIDYHAQILREKLLQRRVMEEARKILAKAQEGGDVYLLLDEMNRVVDAIDRGVKTRNSLTPSEIFERDKNTPMAEKLYLGLSDLDMGIYADSMKRGQVELTIADSGHGKTQYALFKADCLLRRGYKIAWFQLEGYDSETARVFEGLQNQDNIFISHSLYDIEDIKREARMLKREFGIDYIVIDYVQNVECSKNISKTEQVEYISQQITKMAKDLNVVCHPLSQITISYGNRPGWKQEPSYGDVRWSQQLKQDAHIITSVFRPSRVESLVINEDYVRGWKDDQRFPYNSVFIKQAKVRHGKQEWKRLHMIHTDKGLKPYTSQPEPEIPAF